MEMTIQEMRKRFNLQPCDEGGELCELYRDNPTEERPASGVIYYALCPEEYSEFHVIDCDEYWLYHIGSTIEVWMIDSKGKIQIEKLGIEKGSQPCLLIKAGTIFGARIIGNEKKSTLISCVTVPQFLEENFKLFTKDEMLNKHPELEEFYKN